MWSLIGGIRATLHVKVVSLVILIILFDLLEEDSPTMETNTSSTLSPSSSSSHISLSFTLSLPKSCSKHIASKIENLVEYSYISESAQINESQFPIMSPYNLYKQKTSPTRSIRTLISIKRPLPKEYIQSSRLDQCALQASQSEQYVTFELPPHLVANWKREGYTHFILAVLD